ncbi:MAG: hypothetical protein ACYC9J_11675 [Sulfuricaulis sp.]
MQTFNSELAETREKIHDDFRKLTGSDPSAWSPGPSQNRTQFDISPEVVTKADRLWIELLVAYDRCLIAIIERVENGLMEERKGNKFRIKWKKNIIAVTHAMLKKYIGVSYFYAINTSKVTPVLSTESVDKTLNKQTETINSH